MSVGHLTLNNDAWKRSTQATYSRTQSQLSKDDGTVEIVSDAAAKSAIFAIWRKIFRERWTDTRIHTHARRLRSLVLPAHQQLLLCCSLCRVSGGSFDDMHVWAWMVCVWFAPSDWEFERKLSLHSWKKKKKKAAVSQRSSFAHLKVRRDKCISSHTHTPIHS